MSSLGPDLCKHHHYEIWVYAPNVTFNHPFSSYNHVDVWITSGIRSRIYSMYTFCLVDMVKHSWENSRPDVFNGYRFAGTFGTAVWAVTLTSATSGAVALSVMSAATATSQSSPCIAFCLGTTPHSRASSPTISCTLVLLHIASFIMSMHHSKSDIDDPVASALLTSSGEDDDPRERKWVKCQEMEEEYDEGDGQVALLSPTTAPGRMFIMLTSS